MRKNKMMRLASALLVAVLLTTCAISGTFAKYVTEIAEGTDTARVAEWGVKGTIKGEAFAKTYNLDTSVAGAFTLAVESETKVVAPGTTGTFTGIALTGAPEVAVRITTTVNVDLGNKWVDANGDEYCPIVFNVNGATYSLAGMGGTNESADIAALETALENAIKAGDGDYAPNTDLSTIADLNGDYTWTWAFVTGADDAAKAANNIKDTFLGDQAAAGNAATITITVSTVVEQID